MTHPPSQLPQEARDNLIQLFETHHYLRHQTSVLQETGLFLDHAQRDVRPHFYKLIDPEGAEFYLRPDFTVPVCLDYLAGHTRRDAHGISRLSYIGPVFRWHKTSRVEKLQAGIECLGAQGPHPDIEILAVTTQALHQLQHNKDPQQLHMILGDPSLFESLVDALADALDETVRLTLKRRFLRQMFHWPLDGSAHDMALTQTKTPHDSEQKSLLRRLKQDNWNEAALHKSLQEQNIPLIGERSLRSIVERLHELHDRSAEPPKDVASHLAQFFSINTHPRRAIEKVARIAQSLGITLDMPLEALSRLVDHLERHPLLKATQTRFATQFRGSNPGYYTGLVFAFVFPEEATSPMAAGGGRYDGLLAKMHNPHNFPPFGVGAALYLDSLGEKS